MTAFLVAGLAVTVSGCQDPGAGDGETGGGTADDDDDDDDDDADSGTGDDDDDDSVGEIEPVAGGMRRLTRTEYIRSVELMLGTNAGDAADPPDDVAQGGWDAVGNAILSLAAEPVEDYEGTAEDIADAVIVDPSHLAQTVPCVTGSDASCYETVAADLGRWAFRRPMTSEEIDALVAIANEGRAWGDGDFLLGLKYELMAILQAPSFVYLTEVGEPAEGTGYRLLTANELATRISFFLLGRNPDLALLDAADAGELDTEDGIRDWAYTLVQSSEARVATEIYFDEYLRLRNLPTHAKSAELFPLWTESLTNSLRQETLLLLNDVVWQDDGDFRTVFNANYTFINADLAALYGMPAPGGPGFVRVDWPAGQDRAGIISQGSVLALQSGPLRNSPTERGKFIQSVLLCTEIPPPPPDVTPELPEPGENQTLKELLDQHMEDPACASCHGLTDPVGFALEFFDSIGAYRTMDNGSPIDASGEVEGLGSWANAVELANVIAENPGTPTCIIRNFIEGHLGFAVTPGIAPGIEELTATFDEAGYSLQTLMVEIAASPLFRYVDEPK